MNKEISKTIKHTCGHTTCATVDNSTKAWVKHYAGEVCFACKPTETVTRLCGHVEEVARISPDGELFSPRRMESAAMQMCEECNK